MWATLWRNIFREDMQMADKQRKRCFSALFPDTWDTTAKDLETQDMKKLVYQSLYVKVEVIVAEKSHTSTKNPANPSCKGRKAHKALSIYKDCTRTIVTSRVRHFLLYCDEIYVSMVTSSCVIRHIFQLISRNLCLVQ